MSTQPVPTFPVVAGFEKYAGMTLEEVLSEISEKEAFRVLASKVEPWDFDDPNYAFAGREEELANIEFSKSPKLIPFAVELEKFSTNPQNDKMLRKTAWYLSCRLSSAHLTK